MKQEGHLILIGYMGCGKSTVGQRLARVWNCRFADTDALIEEAEGCTVSELFSRKGEAYFRTKETQLLQQLLSQKERMVLATGGGLPLRRENVALVHRLGFVIYLRAGEETLLERLSHDTKRPLLAGGDRRETVHRMLEQRDPVYLAAADAYLQTDTLSMYETIRQVEQLARDGMLRKGE